MRPAIDNSRPCKGCGRTSWWVRERDKIVCSACGWECSAFDYWAYLALASLLGLGGILLALD